MIEQCIIGTDPSTASPWIGPTDSIQWHVTHRPLLATHIRRLNGRRRLSADLCCCWSTLCWAAPVDVWLCPAVARSFSCVNRHEQHIRRVRHSTHSKQIIHISQTHHHTPIHHFTVGGGMVHRIVNPAIITSTSDTVSFTFEVSL